MPYFSNTSYFFQPVMHFLQFYLLFSQAYELIYVDLAILFVGMEFICATVIINDIIHSIQNNIQDESSKIKLITKRHCDIITNINLFKDILFHISFSQLATNTMMLLLLFSCIRLNIEPIMGIVPIIFVMSELFLLCYFGEIIQTSMENLSESLYQTNWYDLSLNDQTSFLIVLGMMQRTYGLKAAGLYKINLYTYIQVIFYFLIFFYIQIVLKIYFLGNKNGNFLLRYSSHL